MLEGKTAKIQKLLYYETFKRRKYWAKRWSEAKEQESRVQEKEIGKKEFLHLV